VISLPSISTRRSPASRSRGRGSLPPPATMHQCFPVAESLKSSSCQGANQLAAEQALSNELSSHGPRGKRTWKPNFFVSSKSPTSIFFRETLRLLLARSSSSRDFWASKSLISFSERMFSLGSQVAALSSNPYHLTRYSTEPLARVRRPNIRSAWKTFFLLRLRTSFFCFPLPPAH